MSTRILVVDDDTALSEMIGIMLTAEGYEPSYCADGASAVNVFHDSDPDLVLLDLMLPGVDGVEICRHIREESDVPVIMLTARTDTQDVVSGLEAGADDYVTKPFKSKELLARVRTRLRRTSDGGNAEHVTKISLPPLEFDLLVTLARTPWKVFTREELLEQVWGYQHAADTRLVNVHVQRLRAKIEHDPEHPAIVVTVRGVGYRAGDAA